MRRLLAILGLLPTLLAADEHWVKFTSPPFEVFSNAGPRPGREAMVRFQEFRHALGQLVGENDLQTPEPVRIMVFKNPQGWATSQTLIQGRDRYAIVLPEKAGPNPALYRELVRLFLKSNTAQMPPAFERGLEEFLSTLEVNGIRITAGAVPEHPDQDWARVHMLVVDPAYYGKIRVLLYNLRKGVDEDPAFRNAFGKGKAEIEAQAKQYFAAGKYGTTSLSSRPLSERDFPEKPVSDADARLARADLLAGAQSRTEYEALLKTGEKIAAANEGLGLLDLREHRNDDARKHFAAAVEANSSSARCYIEYAKLESDDEKAMQALRKAAGMNTKLDEPVILLAQREKDPRKRIADWKAATERNSRNPASWKALAEEYVADHNYSEAAKAWRGGEQAATDPAEREQMRRSRMSIEAQRLDYEAAEKRRQAEEDARELEKLKSEARAELHAAESRMNKDTPRSDAPVVPWWDGPKPPGNVKGSLKQVDCLGGQKGQVRLVVESEEHKALKLLLADPGKVTISGTGDLTLGCGVQKSRPVVVGYFPKTNARLGTAGEVATIEFQ